MLRADLEISESWREIALDSPTVIGEYFGLRVVIVASDSVRVNSMYNFVKSGMAHFEFGVRGVMLLTSRYICELVFYACVHVTDCKENSPGQLVLVVQSQPFGKH